MIRHKRIRKILVFTAIFWGTTQCGAQNNGHCATAVETAILEIRDSLKHQKVYVSEKPESFIIHDRDVFYKKFKGVVTDQVLEKAILVSKTERYFNPGECFTKSIPRTRKEIDSIRGANRLAIGVDKTLNDSIDKVWNELFDLKDTAEFTRKYNHLVSSEAYKRLDEQREKATNRVIYIGMPIMVDHKYIFFILMLSTNTREYFSWIYLYEKNGTDWSLLRKSTWYGPNE